MDRVLVDIERVASDVAPLIYGNFVEHLGRCVYGGIYDETSSKSDADGIRLDVLDVVKTLAPTNLRYPGGNFASGYHWEDGVGPKDRRPKRLELAWRTVESNRFGTNEFIDYCKRVGAEPVLCINAGTGTIDEARAWVEYCNVDSGTAYADLRREHGWPKPHKVKIWDLGNEIDGNWQIGHKSAEDYAKFALEAAKVMKWTDPNIRLVACGDSVYQREWNPTVLAALDGWADYISVHLYVRRTADDLQAYLLRSKSLIEQRLACVEAQIQSLRLQKPPAISFDEWGITGDISFGNHEHRYTLLDAVVTGLYLNTILRHAASVRMANYAQLVNVIAPIMTNDDDLFLQTNYYPMQLSREHHGDRLLDAWVLADSIEVDKEAVPCLDVAATLNGRKRSLTLSLANLRMDKPAQVEIELWHGSFAQGARMFLLTHENPMATNSFADKDNVKPVEIALASNDGRARIELPAHSYALAVFPLA